MTFFSHYFLREIKWQVLLTSFQRWAWRSATDMLFLGEWEDLKFAVKLKWNSLILSVPEQVVILTLNLFMGQ